jgi:hypothetical protein
MIEAHGHETCIYSTWRIYVNNWIIGYNNCFTLYTVAIERVKLFYTVYCCYREGSNCFTLYTVATERVKLFYTVYCCYREV